VSVRARHEKLAFDASIGRPDREQRFRPVWDTNSDRWRHTNGLKQSRLYACEEIRRIENLS
jgi:hypothetical protein